MAAADSGADRSLRAGKKIPYLMVIPGMVFLVVFFILPLISLAKISLSTKPDRLRPVYNFTWKWSNFSDAFSQFGGNLIRSFIFAGLATLLCAIIAYPLAYFIAFRAGRWKNVLIGLVMVPFFTSFLLRTVAWKSILADQAWVMSFFRSTHIINVLNALNITNNGALLNTPAAVVGGLTYNFLPFMLLPIYVSLEKIDRGLFDAAADLYSPFAATFRKVILPLSLPGVFAGTLLTFIPATGDFINAQFLGDPRSQQVIGTAVQSQFLKQNNYPSAAGISFVLMAIIVVLVFVYARFMGTEDLV